MVNTAPCLTRQKRCPRFPLSLLVLKNPLNIVLDSGIVFQSICRLLLDHTNFQIYPDKDIAECSQALPKNKGEIRIAILLQWIDIDKYKWQPLELLGDEIIDTLCAVTAIALSRTDGYARCDSFRINVDDVLALCQKEQSHRAYTLRQRALVIAHLQLFKQIFVSLYRVQDNTNADDRNQLVHSSLLQVMVGKHEGCQVPCEARLCTSYEIRLGPWINLKPPLASLHTTMQRQVLKYHSQRERYPKRLGRYLSLMFRVNKHKTGGVVVRHTGVLLKQAGIKLDALHPERTKRMFEDALARLAMDGIIGRYWVDDCTLRELVDQRARGWWHIYVTWLWHIEPPRNAEISFQ